MLSLLQKISHSIGYLKYPALLLAAISTALILTLLIRPSFINDQGLLFPAIVILIWSILLLFFPAVYKDMPDFSDKPDGILLKVKYYFYRLIYYLFALFFIGLSLALVLLTIKMITLSFM